MKVLKDGYGRLEWEIQENMEKRCVILKQRQMFLVQMAGVAQMEQKLFHDSSTKSERIIQCAC